MLSVKCALNMNRAYRDEKILKIDRSYMGGGNFSRLTGVVYKRL